MCKAKLLNFYVKNIAKEEQNTEVFGWSTRNICSISATS